MLPINPLLHATAPAGPHLPVALLRQYAAGALAPAAQHRVEAHTLACPRCADILDGLLQTPPATTDQAVAHLQQRLRQRVQQVVPTRQSGRLAPRPRWLSLQLAAAAALLLSLLAGGWWAWQQRRLAAPLAARAPRNLPATAAPLGAPPLPYPSLSTATVPTPLPAARLPASLAHPTSRRRRGAAAAASAALTVASPVRVSASEASSQPVAPTPAAAAAPPLPAAPRDSTGLALGSETPAGRSFTAALAPTRVRVGGMPAAAGLAPVPTGGMAALREKLRREAADFVPEAPERPLSGTVQLRLTIGATGKLESISILRGLRADYDAEAQRLVCDGPGWVPGISGGRRATLQVDVAVPF